MKKLLATLIVLPIFATLASAQTSGVVLPEKGSYTVELQFNPISSLVSLLDPSVGLVDGKVQVRYFLSPSTALRAGVGFDFSNNTQSNGEHGSLQVDRNAITSDLALSVGIEKHFVKHGCFDMYCGPMIGIGKHWLYSASHEGGELEESYFGSLGGAQKAGFGINAAMVSGLNVYVFKGLFIGAEIGFAAEYTRSSNVDHTTVVGSSPITIKDKHHTSSFNLGFFCAPALRIGMSF